MFTPRRLHKALVFLLVLLFNSALQGQVHQKVTLKQARTLGPKFALSRFAATTVYLLGLNEDKPYALAPDYTFLQREVDTTSLITEGMKTRIRVLHHDSSLHLHQVYHVRLPDDSTAELLCDARKRFYEPWIITPYDSTYMSVRGDLLRERGTNGTMYYYTIHEDKHGKRFVWRELGKTAIILHENQIDHIHIRNQSKLFRTKGGKFLYDFAWGTAGVLVQFGLLASVVILVLA